VSPWLTLLFPLVKDIIQRVELAGELGISHKVNVRDGLRVDGQQTACLGVTLHEVGGGVYDNRDRP